MPAPPTMHSSALAARYDLLAVSVATALVLSTSALASGDPVRGRARAQMCEGCHGIADYRSAYPRVYPVPKIGEQQPAYIVKALRDYKTGARKHATMRSIAATLSDQDMADLAAYYAGETRK